MNIIKKIIRRFYLEVLWRKNIISKFFYNGEIKIGKKVRFYQPLKLMNGGGEHKNWK